MPTCSHCGKEISCPEHAHSLVAVEPCESQVCSIWVRAIDDQGRPVPGVTAASAPRQDTTRENGFAKLEDLGEGQHEVALGLDDEAGRRFVALHPATRTETLQAGELKLLVVRLQPRVRPTLRFSQAAVPVGATLTLTLATDRPYAGTGTLTCTGGAEAIDVEPALHNGVIDLAQAVNGKREFTIKAKTATALDEIAFSWALDPAVQLGDPAVAKATGVKITLEPHQGEQALGADAKAQGSGLVVHLQDQAKTRKRAKVGLRVDPVELVGEVEVAVAGTGDATLWAQAQGGDAPIDLGAPVPVGPNHPKAYHLEGKRISQGAGDVAVTAKLRGFDGVADRFVVTVIRTRLVAFADRTGTRKDEPLAIADEHKLDPGQTLVRQVSRLVQRTKLVVIKEPAAAACKLKLVAARGADEVGVFPASEEVVVNQANDRKRLTFENVRQGEGQALDLGAGIDLDALDPPVDPGQWIFWLAGKAVTDARAVELQVDVANVETRCDAVAYTVADPTLTLELVRSDAQGLSDAVAVKLVAADKSSTHDGTIPADTGRVAITVPAGHYFVELAPRGNTEKPMRVERILPKTTDAALDVRASTTAKYELAPPYTKVQPIGYWVRTGASRGIDATKALHAERIVEARKDMKAKAALMIDAIQEAAARNADIDAARTTLKIFMAPEFYFRGAQGAYPMEVVSEILGELDGEISKDAYKDWLFVLGTAIGVIAPPEPVGQAKKVTATLGQSWIDEPVNQQSYGMGSPNLRHVGFWLTYVSVARPAQGWAVLSPFIGSVTRLGRIDPPDGQGDWIGMEHNVSQAVDVKALLGQEVRFEDPAEAEIVNVAIVRKGGSAAPSGADGRGLRELLIEKEYVSWNDLPTPVDDGQGRFFEAGRQLITIFGQTCRAKPPQGSFMPQYFGWGNVPNLNLSEVNTSGVGGGSVFTIDRITFGLEVCMDHGMGSRLQRYYTGSGGQGTPKATAGEPRVQVQLVPAGGMAIQPLNICTVVNGIVFNVDKGHVAAKKATGVRHAQTGVPTSNIATVGVDTALTVDSSAHFDTAGPAGNGKVIVYAATDVPPPETVA